MKLNLGSGPNKLEGYLSVDTNEDYADLVADVRDLSSIDTDSVDEILALHIIEHLYLWEARGALKEWLRVLKPGASLYIECPNLRACCEHFLDGTYDNRYHIYGMYGNPNHKEPAMCHRWGYTPETLAMELIRAGFSNIGVSPPGKNHKRDMRFVASKP